MDHDEFAPAALREYAAKCAPTHPQLAAELIAEFGASQQPVPALATQYIPMNELLTDEQVENLSAIIDAYESGIGHGLKDDGHKNCLHSLRTCTIAYGVGYDEGLERAATAAQLAPRPHTNTQRPLGSFDAEWSAHKSSDFVGADLQSICTAYNAFVTAWERTIESHIPADMMLVRIADYEQMEAEALRLDFVLDNCAFTTVSKVAGVGERFQLENLDEDEECIALSGDGVYFETEREAIDAAILAAQVAK